MENVKCIECNIVFKVHRYRKDTARFCTRICYGNSKLGKTINRNPISRIDILIRNLEKNTIKNDGCWGWKAYVNKGGYAQLTCRYDKAKVKLAHRASYIVHKGEIPKDKQVNHICNNPICTNPDHLYLGSQQDNMDDKAKELRQAKGQDINTCKLTEDDVINIRSLIGKGMGVPQLAETHGVTRETIYAIRDRVTWKWL